MKNCPLLFSISSIDKYFKQVVCRLAIETIGTGMQSKEHILKYFENSSRKKVDCVLCIIQKAKLVWFNQHQQALSCYFGTLYLTK